MSTVTKHKQPRQRPILQQPSWRDAVLRRVLAVLMVASLVNLLTVRLRVEGSSMQPTLASGQFLLVSRLHYLLGLPTRGDIVLFHAPTSGSEDYVKRIIGLPLDTVEIRNMQVYLNGNMIEEQYIMESCDVLHCPDGIWQLGQDQYFVLGDNRNDSNDSRYFGAIQRTDLVGKVVLRYYPLTEIGFVNQ